MKFKSTTPFAGQILLAVWPLCSCSQPTDVERGQMKDCVDADCIAEHTMGGSPGIGPQSTNDPRVPSGSGAWFDGWYYRLSDADGKRSVAVIAAVHRPEGQSFVPGMALSGYLAILTSEGQGSPTVSYEAYPPRIVVYSHGRPVSEEPSRSTPSDFAWVADEFGTVTSNTVDVQIPGQVELHMSMVDRVAWDARDETAGPEGLLTFLPVPLHWHVESLGSHAWYTMRSFDKKNAATTISGVGHVHQEKNWGAAFPSAWLWGQATYGNNEAHTVFGGGRIKIAGIPTEPFLAGYRSGQVSMDFKPVPFSTVDKEINACAGTLRIRFRTPTQTLTIDASAPPATFAPVSIPTETGFTQNGGAESFSTTMKVAVFAHDPLAGMAGIERLIEERTFRNAALEFGADYACSR